MERCSILIPTYNRIDLLVKLIKSIQKHTDEELYEILILDNSGGKLKPPEDLKLYNCRWINMENNLGNIAVNYGIKWTNNDIIVQLNDDVEVTGDGWLEALYSGFTIETKFNNSTVYSKDNKVGVIGPCISKVRIQGNTFVPAGTANIDDPYAFAESWCIMFEKEKFMEVNGMNSDIKILYGADFDLSMRFKRVGYLVVKVDVPIVHLRFGTTRNKDYKYCNPDELCAKNLRTLYKYWIENHGK